MNIDIKHIAKLARLRIEDDQLDKFESEMENIVGMVEKLPDIQDEMTLDPEFISFIDHTIFIILHTFVYLISIYRLTISYYSLYHTICTKVKQTIRSDIV